MMRLSVFTTDGETYTFRDVTIISEDDFAITFRYIAMSDGLFKHGTFYKANLAGIAKTTKGE